jgi:hypothetical protein
VKALKSRIVNLPGREGSTVIAGVSSHLAAKAKMSRINHLLGCGDTEK